MHPRLSRSASALLTAALLIPACSPKAPIFTPDQLARLVIQKDEAPEGTTLDAESSGPQTLDEYVEDDAAKRKLFADAGFKTSHFNLFLNPQRTSNTSSAQTFAVSFGMLFGTEAGALQGLTALETSLRAEGQDLKDRPATGLGKQSFGMVGIIDRRLRGTPFGYAYAWSTGNALFGVIVAGPQDTVSEAGALELAQTVFTRTGA